MRSMNEKKYRTPFVKSIPGTLYIARMKRISPQTTRRALSEEQTFGAIVFAKGVFFLYVFAFCVFFGKTKLLVCRLLGASLAAMLFLLNIQEGEEQ